MEVEAKTGISQLTYDQLTALYNKLTSEIRTAEKVVDDFKAKREKVSREYLRRFAEQGVSSVKTKVGTPYIIERTSVTVADKEVFRSWCQANGAEDFMEVRPAKNMVVAYKEQHDDIPPGLNWSSALTIGVKKS